MSAVMGPSLAEALASGQGIERPFRCHEHEDSVASASLNIEKGVWHCFACQASGRVDATKTAAPSGDDLLAMLDPERAARVYADAYLELFDDHEGYWATRHDPAVSHRLGMGTDPLTGDATFAVYSPAGRLAGVGRRRMDPDARLRYVYPRHWSAARSLGGTRGTYPPLRILTLTEGMADAAAVWETGCPGLAVYGSGLHLPQVELLARHNPSLVLLGFDADEAGDRGAAAAITLLADRYRIGRVHWPDAPDGSPGDPSSTPLAERSRVLAEAVISAGYVEDNVTAWQQVREETHSMYQTHLKEDHVTT